MTDQEQRKPDRAKRILIADDNQHQALTLMLLLKNEGYEVRAVFDGPSALSAMRESVPDVALLDIGMPGMHGYELARLIRQEPGFAHTVLIAVTAWGREEDREAAFRAGFDDHLQKPVDLEQLKMLLAE